jgi:hypothetical protein
VQAILALAVAAAVLYVYWQMLDLIVDLVRRSRGGR